jgi:hypothetical protein
MRCGRVVDDDPGRFKPEITRPSPLLLRARRRTHRAAARLHGWCRPAAPAGSQWRAAPRRSPPATVEVNTPLDSARAGAQAGQPLASPGARGPARPCAATAASSGRGGPIDARVLPTASRVWDDRNHVGRTSTTMVGRARGSGRGTGLRPGPGLRRGLIRAASARSIAGIGEAHSGESSNRDLSESPGRSACGSRRSRATRVRPHAGWTASSAGPTSAACVPGSWSRSSTPGQTRRRRPAVVATAAPPGPASSAGPGPPSAPSLPPLAFVRGPGRGPPDHVRTVLPGVIRAASESPGPAPAPSVSRSCAADAGPGGGAPIRFGPWRFAGGPVPAVSPRPV